MTDKMIGIQSTTQWSLWILCSWLFMSHPGFLYSQEDLTGKQVDGYRGIWFELNQKFPHGDKYSGGLATYTAKHIPLAIYAPEVQKTFFVYGGTTIADERHLLCMIGYFDHMKGVVGKPVVVYDKKNVDDPHDNPSLSIDDKGYLWVFVSGRGRSRPGFIFRSKTPYDITSFDLVQESEMTYPQPWFIPGSGFMYLFTKYTGVRELYFRTSVDGIMWTEDRKLAGIKEVGSERSGHYQVSNHYGDKVSTFFNRHPDGNVDQRTDLYYVQTTDFGDTWTNIQGDTVELPLEKVNNSAQVLDFQSKGKNVYVKDLQFDDKGNPMCLYVTSGGHEPGPENDPREWWLSKWTGRKWIHTVITRSDHNYDMGSLIIQDHDWYLVAPTTDGPQEYGTGGEVDLWFSKDKGKHWKMLRAITRNSTLNHSYIRRVLHGQKAFQFFWADGNPDELTISHMYFGDLEGNVWQLPYQMTQAEEEPKKISFDKSVRSHK